VREAMAEKRTKQILRIVLPIATIISMFFVPWVLVKAWILPLPDTMEEHVSESIGNRFDGIIVYVNQSGTEPAFYAAGWQDRKNRIPVALHALFKIANISKLYDAVAITKLVHDGQISLDNTLADFLPNLVGRIEHAQKITLRMLVQNRSGIPNITDTPNFWTNPPKSNEEALGRVLDLPTIFKPGKGYEYSNTNYLLISELIKKVTGMSKFQYIKQEISSPLKLNNTFGSLTDVNMERLMSKYYVGIEDDIKTADYGSMIATAEDVGIFLRALNDGSMFDEGEREIYSSIYLYDHTGLILGYQSIAKYRKNIDTVIIRFVRTINFNGYTRSISEIVFNRIGKILRNNKNL